MRASDHQSRINRRPLLSVRVLPVVLLWAFLGLTQAIAQTAEEQGHASPMETEAILHGTFDKEQNRIRLYWETRDWPSWLIGYQVLFRSESSEAWQDLHPDPIRPSFKEERDWSNQGLTEEESTRLLEARMDTFAAQLPERDAEEVRKILINFDGLLSGDRLAQKLDYNIALFSGFGFIDHPEIREDNPVTSREYGLFPVDEKGIVARLPVSTWSIPEQGIDALLPEQITPGLADGVISLHWNCDRASARQHALIGFRVYRKGGGSDFWTILLETPVGNYDENEELLLFRFYDDSANPSEDYQYAVAAQNAFQEFSSRKSVEFESIRFRPMPLPRIVNHQIIDESDVEISWEIAGSAMDRIAGFYLERAEGNQYKRISPLIGPEARTFADKKDKQYGSVYEYRVVAVDKWSQEATGPRLPLLYLGQSKPPTPEGFSATFKIEEGQPGLQLSWDPVSATDRRTAFYRILTDITKPGSMLIQAHIEPFMGNRFFYPLKINGGRWIEVGILPFTEEGITGDPASARVYMPSLQLPSVAGVQVSFDSQAYSVNLKWDYKDDLPDHDGFQVLMNGSILPEAAILPPESRSVAIKSEEFAKGKTMNFSVVAMGGLENSTPSIPVSVWIRSDPLPEGVEPPEKLSVSLITDDPDAISAEIEWEALEDLEEAGLNGYALMVDYAQEGNVRRLNSLPPLPGPKFRYPLPELENREHFTFRIAAITKENTLGPFSEVVLDLPDNVKPSIPETQ